MSCRSGFWLCVSAQVLFYLLITYNAPLFVVPQANVDDGLFMRLAQSLVDGRWLGPFDQLVLAKGPGYPAFLAFSYWSGLSIGVAHAIFHCFAITAFALVCRRLTGSAAGALGVFTVLMWSPLSFTNSLLRIFRDAIYYAQVLLVVGAWAYALLGANSLRHRLVCGAAGGALLGWAWLTREEGLWLVPGLALLAAVSVVRAYRLGALRPTAIVLAATLGMFMATQVGFRSANWLAYGSFVGVDLKESNFSRALRALHSVRSGGIAPYVSITKAARAEVYRVSAAFASLKDHLESPDNGGAGITCQYQPQSCGEIGAGWFIWVLRNAAAQQGHYASPAKASAFFRRVADDITAACARGDLKCSPQLFAEIPPFDFATLYAYPAQVVDAMKVATAIRMPVDPPESPPNDGQYMRLLGYPPQLEAAPGKMVQLSRTIRAWIEAHFNPVVTPILLSVGLCGAVFSSLHWRYAGLNNAYVLAIVCATLAMSRIALIALIDVTAFRGSHPFYLAPATYSLLAAASLFIIAAVQLRRRSR